MHKGFTFTLILLLLSVACARSVPRLAPTAANTASGTAPTAVTAEIVSSTATAVSPSRTPAASAGAALVEAEIAPPATATPTWPSPMETVDPFSETAVTAAEQATLAELSRAVPPERDDVRLAMAYRGLAAAPNLEATPVAGPLPTGSRQQFTISNIDDNTVTRIEAELKAVSEHAYFWFDTGEGSFEPDENTLAQVAADFDSIYETDTFYFGSENNPGVDGDPRLHIVHASPLVLCNVTLETAANCGLAGYFSASNGLPVSVDANSNVREMFVMNVQKFGTDFYLNVLGHELRHMIEDNYDRGEADWAVEGSAVLAEELLGFSRVAQQRANLFLQDPDQQLNSWTDGNTLPYYGQGYLFNRYLYDRLGETLYRQFATSPDAGLKAIDNIAVANGLDLTGQSLWLDWLVALAIHDDPQAAAIHRFEGLSLDTAAVTAVDDLPASYETTVSQFAADYYALPNDGPLTAHFSGGRRVPLLDAVPASGQMMWYAQRANYSNPRLTRSLDLSDVTSATLHYAVYADIEKGYDFAYASVSENDGRSWQGLVAENMQGLAADDDPADTALTERFYTGRHQAWRQETVDLSPYAGQEIQLRFEYVTDLVLTFGGLALDNIAIPEIGFYDDAETLDPVWAAEGFSRVSAYLPQLWQLQLVTFAGGEPMVEPLSLAADQTVTFSVEGEGSEKRPILIVAAAAPMTLEPAHYQLQVEAGNGDASSSP